MTASMVRFEARSQRYNAVAIALHWLIALAILAMLVMGLAMTHVAMAPVDKFKLYQLHKSVGLTILILAVLRLLWRLTHRPPPLPAGMPAWERHAAETTHVALYVFMIGMPLVGWAMVSVSAFNLPTVLYGVLPWPHLTFLTVFGPKKVLEPLFKLIHAYGGYALIAFVALHAAAALRHYVVERDTVLQRMIPGLPRLGKRPEGDAR
jgi:cytochrome b561